MYKDYLSMNIIHYLKCTIDSLKMKGLGTTGTFLHFDPS